MKVVHEFFCPGCGNAVDSPTDQELQEADEIVPHESSEECGNCEEGVENRGAVL